MSKINKYSGLVWILFLIPSCKKLVDVPSPPTELTQEAVFKNDATTLAAISGIYIKLADGSGFSDGYLNSVTLFEGLYSDELTSYSSVSTTSPRVEFYFNQVTPFNSIVANTWNVSYAIIYECNRLIEGLITSTGVTPALKNQLIGEAKFIRAFTHFYLVNLYGDIPFITNSDYRTNTTVTRTATVQVYNGIITDLLDAESLLRRSPGSKD